MAKIPTQIDKYEIIRRLGHGGMGTVYLARDPDLDRQLAIKVLRDPLYDEELLQRFFREGKASANLRHENIITVYDVGQFDHQPFMAMEYVDGQSLAEVIRTRQPLTLGEKLSYIEQVCAGLHFAHAQGIVHRDVKPANLMVDRYGLIRVLDFGIARIQGSGMTQDGALMGTLSYMSPEQMLGRPVDHRSDIFALGAVAYELLAYRQAFGGTIEDGLLQRLPHEDPPSLAELCPGLPDGLEAIVMRALAKRPEDRFPGLDVTRAAVREIRRKVDPDLQLDPILGPKATPAAGSASDRRDLLERRARQIALHRNAARTALAREDLDGASAACDDALTLDPDDVEAAQILQEIQQARARRAQEAKERHERERTTRQRLADAELRLGRGDVAGAAAALQQALALDPDNTAALTLVSRVKTAAVAGAVEIPDLPLGIDGTLLADRRGGAIAPPGTVRTPRSDDAEAASATLAKPPAPAVFKRPMVIASAVVGIAAVIAAVVWIPRDPSPSDTPDSVKSTPVTPAVPSGGVPAETRSNTPPAVSPATGETAKTPSPDAARSAADSAVESMTIAEDVARKQKAPTLARVTYEEAAQLKLRAQQALKNSDYAEAERRASAATEGFRQAAREALAITNAPPSTTAAAETPGGRLSPAPAPAPIPAAVPTPSVAASPPPVPTPVAVPSPPPAASPTVTASPPPASPPPAPVSRATLERAGILRALNRYQDAYRTMKVEQIRKVYPSLPDKTGDELERAFKDCVAFDVALTNQQVFSGEDPSLATVTARSTYICTPKSRQQRPAQSLDDVFVLQSLGDGEWFIKSMTYTDTAKRK